MKELVANRWVEVDIDAIVDNLRAVERFLGENTRLIAVVKAEAYGLGAAEIAQVLARHGVDFFAVTFASEALNLRKRGINQDILVFAPVHQAEAEAAVEAGLTLTVASFSDYQLLSEVARRHQRRLRVHLKLDTGLGRFGLVGEEGLEVARLIAADNNLRLEGLYTHFAEAASRNRRYTYRQFARFQEVDRALAREGIQVPIRHCCNSAAALKYPHMHLDAVRIGTLLGGQYPAGYVPCPLTLSNPYRFKARVVAIRELPRGSYLGYYRTYRTRNPARIAIVPVGFVDGLGMGAFSRPGGALDLLKIMVKLVGSYLNINRLTMKVSIGGKGYRVRGKVFMQFCLVELPPDFPLEVGAVVEVPIRRTLAARHVARAYFSEGQAVKLEFVIKKAIYPGVAEPLVEEEGRTYLD